MNTAAELAEMSGLEVVQAILRGDAPPPTIAEHMNFRGVSAEHGKVALECVPTGAVLNPLGLVHGGLVSTLLDSAIGTAVHTTLPAGATYASIELSVSFLRTPLPGDRLTAVGRVIKEGRRVSFGVGEVTDDMGRLVASASGSCAIDVSGAK